MKKTISIKGISGPVSYMGASLNIQTIHVYLEDNQAIAIRGESSIGASPCHILDLPADFPGELKLWLNEVEKPWADLVDGETIPNTSFVIATEKGPDRLCAAPTFRTRILAVHSAPSGADFSVSIHQS